MDKEIWIALSVLVIAVLMINSMIFGFVASMDYLECREFGNGTGIQTKWEWGCYAKVELRIK
jgi:hypothetical protein